jgi:glutamine amidotransferase-like uncharacterized protein
LPDPYVGGLGDEGLQALDAFVREGGRIVAIEAATDLMTDLFNLGVSNAVERLESRDFYVPGSLLELRLDTGHALNQGMDESVTAWYWGSSRAFDVEDPDIQVTARYSEGNPVRSGWILGPEYLAGKAAVVEASVGSGSVVLIGFQPNYRAQSMATWPLLFNAMKPSGGERPRTEAEGGS